MKLFEASTIRGFATLLADGGDEAALEPDASRGRSYRADLVDFTKRALVEAKFTPAIEDVRTAIGQLAHYRFLAEQAVPPVKVAHELVLIGSESDSEVKELLDSLNVGIVWRDGERFFDHPHGEFVGDDEPGAGA